MQLRKLISQCWSYSYLDCNHVRDNQQLRTQYGPINANPCIKLLVFIVSFGIVKNVRGSKTSKTLGC